MVASCSDAVTGQQGGIKLWFLSNSSSPPLILNCLPPDGKGQPSSGEYLWARERNWFEIIPQGREGGRGGGQGGGKEKGENVDARGDKGGDRGWILLFYWNVSVVN